MAKITKERASAIGRKSRRKGKSFERDIATYFQNISKEEEFRTVRNSGRTDLAGDVYCIGKEYELFIECKHRNEYNAQQMLHPSAGFIKGMEEIVMEWQATAPDRYPILVIIIKNNSGIWVYFDDKKELHSSVEIGCICDRVKIGKFEFYRMNQVKIYRLGRISFDPRKQ